MNTLTIKLDRFEMEKLRHYARENLRHPQDQARFILRSVLMNEPSVVEPPNPPVVKPPVAVEQVTLLQ